MICPKKNEQALIFIDFIDKQINPILTDYDALAY